MKYIDMTQVISSDMPTYPGTEPPNFSCPCTIAENGFKELKISLYTHTGTHMDSPAHLFSEGLTLDMFSVDNFFGKGAVIDCRQLVESEITFEFISPIKEQLIDVDFVIFYTGWSKKWGQKDYFEGFPSLTAEAAKLLTEIDIKGVGIDAISVEPVTAKELIIHKILLHQDIIIIENLTNLDHLVGKSFTFSCLPLKIKESDGSPVRAVAILEE